MMPTYIFVPKICMTVFCTIDLYYCMMISILNRYIDRFIFFGIQKYNTTMEDWRTNMDRFQSLYSHTNATDANWWMEMDGWQHYQYKPTVTCTGCQYTTGARSWSTAAAMGRAPCLCVLSRSADEEVP